MAGQTFASVTEIPCTCGYLEQAAAEPSSPIRFDPQLNEYHFEYINPQHGTSLLMIYHCPFCGGTTPESHRHRLFAVITEAEEQRLFSLTRGIHTVDDALRLLGTPETEHQSGFQYRRSEHEGRAPTADRGRLLCYERLSETVDVYVRLVEGNDAYVSLQGKYIGVSDIKPEQVARMK